MFSPLPQRDASFASPLFPPSCFPNSENQFGRPESRNRPRGGQEKFRQKKDPTVGRKMAGRKIGGRASTDFADYTNFQRVNSVRRLLLPLL
jgi:hypothetical protein